MKKYKILFVVLLISFGIFFPSLVFADVIEGGKGVIATRYQEAADAGLQILKDGGNAFDAALGTLVASGVVDPMQSGLGSEVFVLFYSVMDDKVYSVNGVGQVPRKVKLEEYLKDAGDKQSTPLINGLIPGAMDVWMTLLNRWGTRKLGEIMAPALELAQGYPLSALMAGFLERDDIKEIFSNSDTLKDSFYMENEKSFAKGNIVSNPKIAETMENLTIAERAVTVTCPCRGENHRNQELFFTRNHFYGVDAAKQFDSYIKEVGGYIDYYDLSFYNGRVNSTELNHAMLESPLHVQYKDYDIYTNCTSSNGVAILEALKIVKTIEDSLLEMNQAERIDVMSQIASIVVSDLYHFGGDSNFVQVPVNGMLSDSFIQERSSLIGDSLSMEKWDSVDPFVFDEPSFQYDGKPYPRYPEPPEVSGLYLFAVLDPVEKTLQKINNETDLDLLDYHSNFVCAADKWGNLVYAVTTNTDAFGCGEMIKPVGFTLNSGMKRFNLEEGHPNSMEAGKRPVSSTSPIMICKNGKPVYVFSASNGNGSTQTIFETIINLLSNKMDINNAAESIGWRLEIDPAFYGNFDYKYLTLFVDENIDQVIIENLKDKGWNISLEPSGINDPDCIIAYDQQTKTYRASTSSKRTATIYAY